MRAFIFNSGRGSRLGALTAAQPKALVPLANGETQIYAETAAAPVLCKMQLAPFSYAGRLLAEIDTPEDLAAVRKYLNNNPQL